jgi:HEAT repeat protein
MDISLLAQQLEQENPEQYERQKAALTLLLDSPDVDAIPALLNVLHHFEDDMLLNLAINALAKIGTDEALNALGEQLFQIDHPRKGKEAARALGYSHSIQALLPLKRLLVEGLNSEKDLPIVEALWALANLCQADIFMPDAEWEVLLEAWKARGGEYSIMARHIRICWDGKIVIR